MTIYECIILCIHFCHLYFIIEIICVLLNFTTKNLYTWGFKSTLQPYIIPCFSKRRTSNVLITNEDMIQSIPNYSTYCINYDPHYSSSTHSNWVVIIAQGDHTTLHFVITCDHGVINVGIFVHISINLPALFADKNLL